MAIQKGKRRKRDRRRRGDGLGLADEDEVASPAPAKPARTRRTPKPLSQRSPLVPAVFAGICVLGAVFTVVAYSSKTVAKPKPHQVFAGPSGFTLLVAIFYLVLAGVETFIALRIYRARGSWR